MRRRIVGFARSVEGRHHSHTQCPGVSESCEIFYTVSEHAFACKRKGGVPGKTPEVNDYATREHEAEASRKSFS